MPTMLKSDVVSMNFHYRNQTNQFLTCKTDQENIGENTATSNRIVQALLLTKYVAAL